MATGASGTGIGIEGGNAAVLTVLFTDIEGSTALTERLGDELWVEVLSAHDAVVRQALRAHRGREVKTLGDGFVAVFGRAHQAVAAAHQLQAGMAAVVVPGVPRGLSIRVGIHTGPVVYRHGDVLGRNVNVARRIVSAASGGQILVSAAVKVLADQEGGLQAGAPTTLRLRGIVEPQVVFDVSVPEAGAGNAARLRLVASG
ncbi:MAG: adenylate/guanylate cyclase domain-containing protein [Acidimicrobiales bacterium]